MQNSLKKSQGNPDERANSMEDSSLMTIEYLRARLLSERLVSKAAKERADELAKQVEELEEQLKIVTFQRKKAEKATLQVLSFLASHGISDISEMYESGSDEEESLCQSSEGRCDAAQEAGNSGSLQLKENDEVSGSDHDSTTSSGRPLSWKGRKEAARLFDEKYTDSYVRRRMNLAQASSSPRHRSGKSCRQIKRREVRSVAEEARHDSVKSDAEDSTNVNSSDNLANCLDIEVEKSKRFLEKNIDGVVQKNDGSLSFPPQARESDYKSPNHKHQRSGEMERALEHQAQLIGRYEAQEKAQRDWEEKYGETNISTPDSCEPGNHSDVTEERDENKEAVHHPREIIASTGEEQKAPAEAGEQSKQSSIHQFNSFKIPHADKSCLENHNHSDTQASPSRSMAPDFSFSMTNNHQTKNHEVPRSFHSSAQSSPHFEQSTSPIPSSYTASSFYESETSKNQNRHRELVPREEPERLGTILGALQEAKLLIKRQLNVPPETSSSSLGKPIETSFNRVQDSDWLKIPVGCPGLFRLPTDFQSQAPTQNRLLSLEYSSEMTNSSLYPRPLPSQDDRYISGPGYSRTNVPEAAPFPYNPTIEAEPIRSTRQLGLNFQFPSSSSNPTTSSYANFPNFFPGTSSQQMSYSPVMRTDVGITPTGRGNILYDKHDFRPNMYR